MDEKTIQERMGAIKQGCADIQFKITQLESELQQAKAQLDANRGALLDCEYWLGAVKSALAGQTTEEETNE